MSSTVRTLAQCRQHFGRELTEVYTDPGELAFGIKYRHYMPEEDAPRNGFEGLLVRVMFDSDGTVGRIQYEKNNPFSHQEIERLLKSASAVEWRGVPSHPREWSNEEVNEPTRWVGEHNGVILFDAAEWFDYFDCGHDHLTVTTR
jgi:hypothetical protein